MKPGSTGLTLQTSSPKVPWRQAIHMNVAASMPASPAGNELDVYITADGSVVPANATLLVRTARSEEIVPGALLDLSLGLLAEGAKAVNFIWRDDETASYWNVHIERAVLGTRLAARLRGSRTEHLPFSLTERELEVVTLMIAGLSNAAIAQALTISPRTVTTHVDHIMRKMHAPNRAAAATVALDTGIVAVPLPADTSEFQTLRIGRIVRSAGTRRRPTAPQTIATGPTTPILVGSMVPLEGRAREDGVEMIRGATLALDEINALGGIHGHPLQLVVQHVDVDRTGLSNVTEAMHRLLSNGVHAITSGYLLHQARAVELAGAEGIPFLHASASSYIDDVVSADPTRFRGIFQVCPTDRNYAPSFVDFMTRLRDSGQWNPHSRELVIAQQSMWEIIDFGLERAMQLAREQGWDLVPVNVTDREGTEQAWADLPARIGAPAAVMLGSFFADDHLRFLDSFLATPSASLVYSIYAPSLPGFRRRSRGRADGLLWASTTGTYSDEIARQFARAYTSKFTAPPGRSMAGISYDRIQILAQAWSQTGDPRDYDEVASRLLRTRFRGVNGSYVFTGSGHGTVPLDATSRDPSIAQAHTIFQLQKGRNVLLDPAVYATGRFVPPSWLGRHSSGRNT